MTMQVQCGQCAKRFAAAPHLAGKQVRCPGCGGTISVPTAAAGARTAPASGAASPAASPHSTASPSPASPASRFAVSCPQCSKRFAASSNLAGKNVRCPGCGGVITVPAPGTAPAASSVPPRTAAASAGAAPGDIFSATLADPEPAAAGLGGTGASGPAAGWDSPASWDGSGAATSAYPLQVNGGPAGAYGGRSTPSKSNSTGNSGFLATHKMMIAVAAGTLLMLPLLVVRGHGLAAVALALAGGVVAACGFLPQKSPQERAAAQTRRERSKAGASNAGKQAAAGGGGAVVVVVLIGLRILARASRRMDTDDGGIGTIIGFAAAGGFLMVLVSGLIWLYIHLGRKLGFYQTTAGGYLALGGLAALILAAMPAGGDEEFEMAFGPSATAGTTAVAAAQDVPPLAIESPLPRFPNARSKRTVAPGVEMSEVRLDISEPGHANLLYVYTPAGDHPRHSLPCVFIAPAGAPPVTGMELASGDRPEHIPWVREGFAVVAYAIDGPLRGDPDSASDVQWDSAFLLYQRAAAGLYNARNALEYALQKMPEVDPNRLYTAGHSSAGRQALLFAEHEPRIKGCVSFAGVSNVPEIVRPYYRELKDMLTDVDPFLQQTSPHNHAKRLRCPVFLFHARDDSVVPYSQSEQFANLLRANGTNVTLEAVGHGDHYDPMIQTGIPAAIRWVKSIDGESPRVAASSPSTGTRPPNTPPTGGGSPGPGSEPPGNMLAGGERFPAGGLSPAGGSVPSASGENSFETPGLNPGVPPGTGTPPQPNVPAARPTPPSPRFPEASRPPGFGPPSGFGPPPGFGSPPGATPPRPSPFGPRGGNAPGSAGPTTGRPSGQPVNLDQLLSDIQSGDTSRSILATAKLRGASAAHAERKSEVARVLVEQATNGQLNVAIASSMLLTEWATKDEIPQLEAALDQSNPLIRTQIFQALTEIKDPAVIPILAKRLAHDQDRIQAGQALIRRGEEAEAEVLKYAEDPDRQVRTQVVSILNRIATDRSLPVLEKMAQSDPDRGVQASARSLLRRIGRRQ